MARFFTHIFLWVILIPYCASSIWLWIDALIEASKHQVVMMLGLIPALLVFGLYGIIYCSILTLPLSLLCYGILSQFPRLIQKIWSRVTLITTTALIGLGWATHTAQLLNTGRSEYALLLTGLIGGAILGLATVRLWSPRSGTTLTI